MRLKPEQQYLKRIDKDNTAAKSEWDKQVRTDAET